MIKRACYVSSEFSELRLRMRTFGVSGVQAYLRIFVKTVPTLFLLTPPTMTESHHTTMLNCSGKL